VPDTDHNHPDHEATFSKVATILEQLAGALRDHVAQTNLSHAKIDAALERLTIKGAETEDKLNGLIDLMDRHIREQ
jgi:hypothetical protein